MRRYFGYFKSMSLECIQPRCSIGGKQNLITSLGTLFRIEAFW